MIPAHLFLLALSFSGISNILGQSTTCDAIQQFTRGSFICSSPPNCCTRFVCNFDSYVPLQGGLLMSDFQVNPCSSPPSLSALITAGDSVLLNQTDISTTQHVPINYFGRSLGADLILFVNSTQDSLTFSVTLGVFEVIPETTIPIDTTQCSSDSSQPSCFPSPVTDTGPNVVPSPPPSSRPTCQALQQVASRNSLGMNTNDCVVSNGCTQLSCTYLDLFPFSVTILPCSSPPAVEFSINNTDGTVLVDETVSRTRVISLEDLAPDSAVYLTVEHPCNRSAMVIEVTMYFYFNYTIVPRTEIPIDQSNCSSVAPTSDPCTAPPATPTSTCDGLLIATQTSGGLCFTNSQIQCTSMACDLSSFLYPVSYNITVLPCLDVPGIELLIANNGSIVLDEVLTQSRSETVNVGPTNISLNVIVLQSTDMSSIKVGVELVVPGTPVSFPIFPVTQIPLDRCSCPQIDCTTSAPQVTTATIATATLPQTVTANKGTAIVVPSAVTPIILPTIPSSTSGKSTIIKPITSGGSEPVDATSSSNNGPTTSRTNAIEATSPQSHGPVDATTMQGTTAGQPEVSSSTGSRGTIVPIVIAVLLFVGLLVAIAAAVIIFVVMKRRNDSYRKGMDSMTYDLVKRADSDAVDELA